MAGITIRQAAGADDLAAAARLFSDYAASLPIDLAYQDFAAELASLPGRYAPPGGALLLAVDAAGSALGCVALRPMATAGAAEIKRLYVAPAGRGLGLGRALAEAVIAAARAAGHRRLLLGTLPDMDAAQRLYGALGFVPVPRYYDTPVEGTLFFGLTPD